MAAHKSDIIQNTSRYIHPLPSYPRASNRLGLITVVCGTSSHAWHVCSSSSCSSHCPPTSHIRYMIYSLRKYNQSPITLRISQARRVPITIRETTVDEDEATTINVVNRDARQNQTLYLSKWPARVRRSQAEEPQEPAKYRQSSGTDIISHRRRAADKGQKKTDY